MPITPDTLDEIRRRSDLISMIASRVTLKRAGGLFKACCPFHQEKTPSFVVYPEEQRFHCFGCQAHGDVIDFVMRTQGMTFVDAVRRLADQTGIALDAESDGQSEQRKHLLEVLQKLSAFYVRCLHQSAEAEPARHYLKSRNIDASTIDMFQIGYAPQNAQTLTTWAKKYDIPADLLEIAGMRTVPQADPSSTRSRSYDRFRARLMFPICNIQGHVIAFSGRLIAPHPKAAKYINSPETPLFQKNRVIYGLDRAGPAILGNSRREALVCEGQIDVIRCHMNGFPQAVAPLGTAFTAEHAKLLSRYAESVVLAFDGDNAGTKASIRTAALFLQCGIAVRIAAIPEGDDPDSLLQRESTDAFRARLETAGSIIGFQLDHLRKSEPNPDAIDAVSRMSRSAVELIAQCSHAVQRAFLVRETAQILGLPIAAVEEDLEQRRAKTSPLTSAATAPQNQPMRTPEARIPTANSATAGPFPEETALCELVCHHDDDIPVIRMIRTYLPLELVTHVPCQMILNAAIQSCLDGVHALEELQHKGAPSIQRWLDKMVTADHRVAGARDATPEDAARHCILKLWRRRLAQEMTQIRNSKQPDSEKNVIRRFEIVTLSNRLEAMDWTASEPLIMREIRRLQVSPAERETDT